MKAMFSMQNLLLKKQFSRGLQRFCFHKTLYKSSFHFFLWPGLSETHVQTVIKTKNIGQSCTSNHNDFLRLKARRLRDTKTQR